MSQGLAFVQPDNTIKIGVDATTQLQPGQPRNSCVHPPDDQMMRTDDPPVFASNRTSRTTAGCSSPTSMPCPTAAVSGLPTGLLAPTGLEVVRSTSLVRSTALGHSNLTDTCMQRV